LEGQTPAAPFGAAAVAVPSHPSVFSDNAAGIEFTEV
jgi:hypothetical protein